MAERVVACVVWGVVSLHSGPGHRSYTRGVKIRAMRCSGPGTLGVVESFVVLFVGSFLYDTSRVATLLFSC